MSNEVLCVPRVKILVARKLGREQKKEKEQGGGGAARERLQETPRF